MKKTLRITVNGKTYDVVAEVLDDGSPAPLAAAPVRAASAMPAAATAPAPASKPAAAPTGGGGPGDVVSPLAGKVVSINSPVGSAVTDGQVVIVLEAMKMNTEVTAHTSGTVKSVAVQPGDGVEEGQLLMTIE